MKVGDKIVVNYSKGPYNVVDYITVITSLSTPPGHVKFSAPTKEQGNPMHPGPPYEWSLGPDYVKAALFAVGDRVVIIGEMSSYDIAGWLPTSIGCIGTVIKTAPSEVRIALDSITSQLNKDGGLTWYYPLESVQYIGNGTIGSDPLPVIKVVPKKKIKCINNPALST